MYTVQLWSTLRVRAFKLMKNSNGFGNLNDGLNNPDVILKKFHYLQFVPQPERLRTRFNLKSLKNINNRWMSDSSLPPKPKKTSFNPLNVFSWKSVKWAFFVGAAYTGYVIYLKNVRRDQIKRDQREIIGKAAVGGTFDLIDQNNKPVSSKDLLGKWLLIYFGFTHCPDICPDEIERMVKVVNEIGEEIGDDILQPIFITVDPERDSPSAIGKYLKEFSDKIIGLTGSVEQISQACKAYRVYFSAGPKDEDNDYIVDHTIVIYFVGPDGEFIDYFTQRSSIEQMVQDIKFYIGKNKAYQLLGITKKLKSYIF